jgi:hypothetical protein
VGELQLKVVHRRSHPTPTCRTTGSPSARACQRARSG